MRLEVGRFPVKGLRFGAERRLAGGVLTVERAALNGLLSGESAFKSARVELVHPGERVRLVGVLDAIAPMLKVDGGGVCYPGVGGPAHTGGSGRNHLLTGVAVVQCGVFPEERLGVASTKHGLIDMFGPAAPYCNCAQTANLVLVLEPASGVSNLDFDSAVRQAGMRVANYLAEATRDLTPEVVAGFELAPADPALPRVVYVHQLQDQGPLIRALLYGRQLGEDFVPTLLHPNEILDGAIVSANFRSCMKLSTWLHVHNPVLQELYARHGRDLNFLGVIVTRGHHGNHFLKERSAEYAAKLARLLGARGAMLTLEGTGNGTLDFMFSVKALEQAGVKTVGIIHELGGPEGQDARLVDSVAEADTLISTGGAEQLFTTEPPERVIGGERMLYYTGIPGDPRAGLAISGMECYCGFWQMGQSGFTAQDY